MRKGTAGGPRQEVRTCEINKCNYLLKTEHMFSFFKEEKKAAPVAPPAAAAARPDCPPSSSPRGIGGESRGPAESLVEKDGLTRLLSAPLLNTENRQLGGKQFLSPNIQAKCSKEKESSRPKAPPGY